METSKVLRDMAVELKKSIKPESIPLISAETSAGNWDLTSGAGQVFCQPRIFAFVLFFHYIHASKKVLSKSPWVSPQ